MTMAHCTRSIGTCLFSLLAAIAAAQPPTPIEPGTTQVFVWDMEVLGPTVDTPEAFKLCVDATCAAIAGSYSTTMSTPIPAMTPGPHTIRVQACKTYPAPRGEVCKETPPLAVEMLVITSPAQPSKLRLGTTPSPPAGAKTMARDFNGSSQYIDFGSIASPTANFFVSVWVHLDPLSGNRQEIISNETGAIGGFALHVTTGGKARFGVFNGANYPEVEGATTLTDSVWIHLLGVRDNTADELRIYVDGVLDGTAGANNASGAPAAGGTLTIARSPLGAIRYVDGRIGRIASGNSVPSGGEIAALAVATNDPASVITCAHVLLLDGPDPEPDEQTAATGDLLPNGSEPALVDGPEVGGGGGANPWYYYAQQ